MVADDEERAPEPGRAARRFAGDLLLALAADGRLVVDPRQADLMIASLELTLEAVTERLLTLQLWQGLPAPVRDELTSGVAQPVVDAVFADQVAPGRLDEAARELPKYVEALKLARRGSRPPAC